MTEIIDRVRAVELLRKVVEAKGPDYLYGDHEGNTCRYFGDDGSPSCVVGHVFAEVGVTRAQLRRADGDGRVDANTSIVEAVTLDGVEMTPGALTVLHLAQSTQDMGESWGEALRQASERSDAMVSAGVL